VDAEALEALHRRIRERQPVGAPKAPAGATEVARAVATEFGVTQRAILAPRPVGVGRPREPLGVSTARQVLAFLLRERDLPAAEVARYTQRDESSERHAARTIRERIKTDKELAGHIRRIREALAA